MARFKKVPSVHESKVVYYDGIIDGIVLLAIKEVQYVELDTKETNSLTRNKAIKVRKAQDGIHIDVTVKIHYSQNVSDMAFKIQEAVRVYYSDDYEALAKKIMGIDFSWNASANLYIKQYAKLLKKKK